MGILAFFEQSLESYHKMMADPDEIQHFSERQVGIISKEIEDRRPLDYSREVALIGAMAIYGTWRGILGVCRISHGDRGGWEDLHSSFNYRAWRIRTVIASGDRVRRTKNLLLRDGFSESLAHAIVLNDHSFARWCGARIISSYQQKERAFTNDPYRTPFEPFIVQLYALWQKIPFDISRFHACDLGAYGDLVDTWLLAGEQLVPSLIKACDYHCDERGFGSYANVPYLHFPVEILATLVIRKRCGLFVPSFSHPLMETPFCQVPIVGTNQVDPMLDGAVKKIRECHPEIPFPW